MGELQRVAVPRSTAALPMRSHDAAPPARSERQSAPPLQHLMAVRALQPKLAIGAVDDAFEREAERTAREVTGSDAPGVPSAVGGRPLAASLMRMAQRAIGKRDEPVKKDDDEKKRDPVKVQRHASGAGPEVVPAGIEASIQSLSGGGEPLPASLRAELEPRFGYDFSNVRAHTGNEAAASANALGARAFTVGDHIFFGAGEYQPSSLGGRRLLAHELTHTIQQQPAAGRAARLRPAVSRAPVQAAPRRVQRLFDDVKESIRNKVKNWIKNDFPPWDLITLIIGWDPIDEKAVKGSTRDWIRAALKIVPDGLALFDKLDKEGKIDALAKWWDTEVAKLDLTMAKLVALVKQAWDAVGPSDVFDPFGAWNKKIKPIFAPVVERVWNFVKAVGGKVLEFVKDVVLKAIGDWAKQQKGYTLLTFALGKDPITGEEVKRTAKGLIYAVLDLVPDGDKIKENLEKSKTIEKAAAWFSEEFKKLDLTWEGIKLLFRTAWDAFKVADLLAPKVLFDKMAAIFGPPLLRLLKFLLAVAKKVLELIFEGAMLIAGPIGLQIVGIVRKIGATFNKIVEDPIRFVGNLVQAVKLGLNQFAKNIWEHLKQGLIAWLVGGLEGAGLVLPKVWDLRGILDLVLQILGITYAKIRAKLVKVLGEDTVATLEKVFAFIKTLVTEGPAAAWKQIVEAIGGLWDLVIGGIKDWAVTKIVTAAITKLVTMFNPAGAIIQAIIATYNTVAFFIERIKQILALVEAIVDSVANIAEGKLAQAANWVEKAMARTIPVILGFLARLIGLGDISAAVKKVITAIQEKVDKGIDFLIKWVVDKAKSLVGKKDDKKPDEPHDAKWEAGVAGVQGELTKLDEAGQLDEAKLKESVPIWKKTYGFSDLTVEASGGEHEIDGAMSTKKKVAALGHLGTHDDPFPLTYPKPANAYPVLYFGEETGAVRTQDYLKEAYEDPKRRADLKVKKYVPFPSGSQALPHGKEIGIRDQWAIKVGDEVGPLQQEGTPGGGKINDQLRRYGFRPNGMQGDHRWEIQFGGKDVIENLWPLDKSVNNAAGNYLKNLEVNLPSGKKKKISELKTNARKYWFVVKSFKQP